MGFSPLAYLASPRLSNQLPALLPLPLFRGSLGFVPVVQVRFESNSEREKQHPQPHIQPERGCKYPQIPALMMVQHRFLCSQFLVPCLFRFRFFDLVHPNFCDFICLYQQPQKFRVGHRPKITHLHFEHLSDKQHHFGVLFIDQVRCIFPLAPLTGYKSVKPNTRAARFTFSNN